MKNDISAASPIVTKMKIYPPQTRDIAAVVMPARTAREICHFIDLAFQAQTNRYNAMNRKKKPADSFSGIPAIVLGSMAGISVRNRDEIRAIALISTHPMNQ